jgi:microcystin-dependent protein
MGLVSCDLLAVQTGPRQYKQDTGPVVAWLCVCAATGCTAMGAMDVQMPPPHTHTHNATITRHTNTRHNPVCCVLAAGKKSLAMEAFARALRQLPTTIADNAGLDSAGEGVCCRLLTSMLRSAGFQMLCMS